MLRESPLHQTLVLCIAFTIRVVVAAERELANHGLRYVGLEHHQDALLWVCIARRLRLCINRRLLDELRPVAKYSQAVAIT